MAKEAVYIAMKEGNEPQATYVSFLVASFERGSGYRAGAGFQLIGNSGVSE